jgi:hypothetical protein
VQAPHQRAVNGAQPAERAHAQHAGGMHQRVGRAQLGGCAFGGLGIGEVRGHVRERRVRDRGRCSVQARHLPAVGEQPLGHRPADAELAAVTTARRLLGTDVPSVMIFCDLAMSSLELHDVVDRAAVDDQAQATSLSRMSPDSALLASALSLAVMSAWHLAGP